MTVTQLNLKARTAADGRMEPPETATQRIRRLQLEAKMLAREQVEAFCDELADGLAGVGTGDFADLVGIEPDLTLSAAND